MTDLSFLTNTRSRRALEAAGIATLEQALAAGKDACLRVKYVADATWAEIEQAAERRAVQQLDEPGAPGEEGWPTEWDYGARVTTPNRDRERLNHVIRYLRGQCSDLPEVE